MDRVIYCTFPRIIFPGGYLTVNAALFLAQLKCSIWIFCLKDGMCPVLLHRTRRKKIMKNLLGLLLLSAILSLQLPCEIRLLERERKREDLDLLGLWISFSVNKSAEACGHQNGNSWCLVVFEYLTHYAWVNRYFPSLLCSALPCSVAYGNLWFYDSQRK